MKRNVFKDRPIFLTSILLLTSIMFIFFQPALSAVLNPTHSSDILTKFLQETTNEGKIDAQGYWETRERYNPGTIKYERNGLNRNDVDQKLGTWNVHIQNNEAVIPFLTFESSRWESIEMLVEESSITHYIAEPTLGSTRILLDTDTEIISYPTDRSVQIIFIKPVEEMQTANGFFDYRGYDTEYLQGKYWLSISEVIL